MYSAAIEKNSKQHVQVKVGGESFNLDGNSCMFEDQETSNHDWNRLETLEFNQLNQLVNMQTEGKRKSFFQKKNSIHDIQTRNDAVVITKNNTVTSNTSRSNKLLESISKKESARSPHFSHR